MKKKNKQKKIYQNKKKAIDIFHKKMKLEIIIVINLKKILTEILKENNIITIILKDPPDNIKITLILKILIKAMGNFKIFNKNRPF